MQDDNPMTIVHCERRFMEKSRRKKPGNIKLVENYLRNDTHCGLENCSACMDKVPPVICLEISTIPIVVPDAVSLVQYVDLFCDDMFAAKQVLLLQSVLERALDMAATREANQIESWLDREDDHGFLKRYGYFPNKHSIDTYVPTQAILENDRLGMESFDSRDRRRFANTIQWFVDHAPTARFVVLSDDQVLASFIPPHNRIGVVTCETFISNYCLMDYQNELQSLRVECADSFATRNSTSNTQGFTKHEENLDNFQKGLFEVSSHHPLEAFVKRGAEERIFIYGRDDMNRAIHGDTVAVELLPREQWLAPDSSTTLVHHVTEDSQKKHHHTTSGAPVVPTGRIVGIISRPPQTYVATILSTAVVPGDDYVLAVPMDIRIPKIRLRSQNALALVDHRLTVVIDSWPIDSYYPQGHYTSVLGPVGDLETEIQALLVQHSVHANAFSEPALACLPDVQDVDWDVIAACDTTKRPHIPLTNDWKIPEAEIAVRRDIRQSHQVFSVDPPGCQDIDDAMSLTRLPNGNFELGVHIADVGYFVLPDTALDLEAQNRATTVYLVDRRYDMLPVILSGDLCSIHCKRDRLAFSVFWELDKNLNFIPGKVQFSKSVLHSVASMTYNQADRLLNDLPADDPTVPNNVGVGTAGQPIASTLQKSLREDLLGLREIGRKLYRQRALQGAVDLSKGEELKFTTDDDGNMKVTMKQALEIHSTIAELMILANSTVAERLVKTFPQSAMLRRHVPPSGNRFNQLLELASTQNIKLDTSSNMALQQSFESASIDKDTLALLKSMATRAMSEAEYICASEATGQLLRFGHYGLGLEFYTHFTSPIRRYADVIVHRQLQETLENYTPQIKTITRSTGVHLPASLVPSVLGVDYRPAPLATETIVETLGGPVTKFPTQVLVPLSHHMNNQNRNAKQVSRACEELFLALYFKSHVSIVNAVVTAVKQNGLLVYIPQFDVRAPVYLKDRDGDVHLHKQMIPGRLHKTLQPPKYGFAQCSEMYHLPNASLICSNDRLSISISGGSLSSFELLQEIQVQVSCEFSSANVRLPELRLLLVSPEKGNDQVETSNWQSQVFTQEINELSDRMKRLQLEKPRSMYASIKTMDLSTTKINESKKATVKKEKKAVGRVIFGGFEPVIDKKYNKLMTAHYEGRSAELEEAMTIQRSAIKDIGDTKRYEMDALRRTEKLMAEKRHDRINQRRKANN